MLAFGRILALVNPSTSQYEALRRAARIAMRNQAELSVLAVLEEVPSLLRELIAEKEVSWIDRQAESVRRDLENLGTTADLGYPLKAMTSRSGDTAIEAIREVLIQGHDLVVKDREVCSSGAGLTRDELRLLRKCPCPVWLVAPPPTTGLGRVLAAVDLKPEPEAEHLNRKIILLAQSLLGNDGGELHIAHAWNDIGLIYWGRRMSVEQYDGYSSSLRKRHNSLLHEFVDSVNAEIPDAQVHLLETEPGTSVPALVEQLGVSTIVMGTVARAGIAGFLMGNTAEQVLQKVNCSVLAVKPDGFETPVKVH